MPLVQFFRRGHKIKLKARGGELFSLPALRSAAKSLQSFTLDWGGGVWGETTPKIQQNKREGGEILSQGITCQSSFAV